MNARVHRRKGETTWTITLRFGPDGESRQSKHHIRGFATKKDAKAELRRCLTLDAPAITDASSVITFRQFLEEQWFVHLARTSIVRPTTLRNYRQLATIHIIPLIGDLPIRRVRTRECQMVLDAMTEAGRSPHTVAHARACMSAAFRFANQVGLLDKNPTRATRAPHKQPRQVRAPNPDELRRIINAAQGSRWEIPVLLSATTGARRSEILALRWSNVMLSEARIRIVESLQRVNGEFVFTRPKSTRSNRTIPLTPNVVDALRIHRSEQAGRLRAQQMVVNKETLVCERGDGRPIDPSTYGHAAARLGQSIGLTSFRLHDLRHGVATLLARHTERAELTSRLLGHSSVAFTLQTYVHPQDDELDALGHTLANALFLDT
jgi:integrase